MTRKNTITELQMRNTPTTKQRNAARKAVRRLDIEAIEKYMNSCEFGLPASRNAKAIKDDAYDACIDAFAAQDLHGEVTGPSLRMFSSGGFHTSAIGDDVWIAFAVSTSDSWE